MKDKEGVKHIITYIVIHLDAKTMVITKEEFQKYSNDVGKAFIVLQTRMKALLKSANCGDLKNACVAQMHNPSGVELSQELIDKILATESSDKFYDLLVRSPYWSWFDIRILEMIVIASENSQALELLNNYKSAIFSKQLIDLLPNIPSKKVKEEYYAKVITKIEKDPNDITVADLFTFQSQLERVIMGIKQGVCVLDHLKDGCVEVHWYIPRSCVARAYWTARANQYQFDDLQLQYLIIGHYPEIQKSLPEFNGTISYFCLLQLCNVSRLCSR